MLIGSQALVNDPYYNDVVLHLRGYDAQSGQVFKDYSKYNRTISVFGNTSHSTTQKKYGNSSIYFNGSGDYLSINYTSELNILSGNFAIETFIRPLSLTGYQTIVAQWNQNPNLGGFILWLEGSAVGFAFGAISENYSFMSGGSLSINTWYFIQIIRSGSNFYLYVNGSLVASYTSSATRAGINIPISLGDYYNINSTIGTTNPDLNAYIEDLRITKGIARPIAVPTQPFPNW